MPDFIKPGASLHFDVKILSIQKQEDFEKEQKAMMEKQNEEMKVQQNLEQDALQKYLSENKIKAVPTESGLYYIETKKGGGAKAEAGKKVKVEYRGTLLDGTEFDASKKHGQPFEFTLGTGQVIMGWDEGISMMRAGGKAKLIVPSKLGYGSRGTPSIPPFSTLVFEVELLEVN